MEKINPQKFWDENPGRYNYKCEACQDTGWIMTNRGATLCRCRRALGLAKRREKALLRPAMLDKKFENFNLNYYPVNYGPTDKSSPSTNARKIAEEALSAAKSFADQIASGRDCRGLIFEGEVGRGKTFLAAAICNALVEKGVDCLFLVVPEFLDEMRFSFQDESLDSEGGLTHRAETVPVLFLDDLGAHYYSDWTKNKIFTILNYRLNNRLPCVITTNLTVDDMANAIGNRSVSRIMEMCDYHFLLTNKDLRHNL